MKDRKLNQEPEVQKEAYKETILSLLRGNPLSRRQLAEKMGVPIPSDLIDESVHPNYMVLGEMLDFLRFGGNFQVLSGRGLINLAYNPRSKSLSGGVGLDTYIYYLVEEGDALEEKGVLSALDTIGMRRYLNSSANDGLFD
ncbi:MAG: hypothetical protein Q7S76_01825 [bacterium]|nr:hypothetical protein [bacterium]